MSGARGDHGPTQPYSLDDTGKQRRRCRHPIWAPPWLTSRSARPRQRLLHPMATSPTITVVTSGPLRRTGVTFTDNLPSGTTFVSPAADQRRSFTCAAGRRCQWNGELQSCQHEHRQRSVLAGGGLRPSGTLIENQITVTSTSVGNGKTMRAGFDEGWNIRSDVEQAHRQPSHAAATTELCADAATPGRTQRRNVGFVESLPAGTNPSPHGRKFRPTFLQLSGSGRDWLGELHRAVSAQRRGGTVHPHGDRRDCRQRDQLGHCLRIRDLSPSGSFGAAASATTSVLAPPTIAMAFTPAVIAPDNRSR